MRAEVGGTEHVGGKQCEPQKTPNSTAGKVVFPAALFSRGPRRLLSSRLRVRQAHLVNRRQARQPERFGFTSAPTPVRPDPAEGAGRGSTYARSIFSRVS